MFQSTSWLYVTCGGLFGGFAIRYIGFRDGTPRHKGLQKFISTFVWLQGGITITAISTYILKLSRISLLFEKYPTLSIILTILGFIKFYPTTPSNNLVNPNTDNNDGDDNNDYHLNWIQWIIFWNMPAIYFCRFDYDTLEQSAIYSFALYTTCFTAGTIIPLHNNIIEDIGIQIVKSSIAYFIFGLVLKLAPIKLIADSFSMSILFNSSLIILLTGLLVDDLQHIKFQYETENDTITPDFRKNPDILKKSIPLFMEITFIFGRIAVILVILNESKE